MAGQCSLDTAKQWVRQVVFMGRHHPVHLHENVRTKKTQPVGDKAVTVAGHTTVNKLSES